MNLNVLRLVSLFAAIFMLTSCASVSDTGVDPANDIVPTPAHDDSHGWGAGVKGI